jgi:hypothetical protein
MAVGDPADESGDLFVDFRDVVFFAALREVDLAARWRAAGLRAVSLPRLADLVFFAGFVFAVALLRAFSLVEELRVRAFAAPFLGFAIARLLPHLVGECEC